MLPKPSKKPLPSRPAEKKEPFTTSTTSTRPKLAALDTNQDTLTFKTAKIGRGYPPPTTTTKENADPRPSQNQTRLCRLPGKVLQQLKRQREEGEKNKTASTVSSIRVEGGQEGAQLSFRAHLHKKVEVRREAVPPSLRASRLLSKKVEASHQGNAMQERKPAGVCGNVPSPKAPGGLYLPNPLHLLLPDNIVDFDTLPSISTPDEWEDPQQCAQYANDIYQHLLTSETAMVYRITPELMSQQTEIAARHRRVLLDWLVQVHVKFDLYPETLHICIDMIDRYLQVSEKQPQNCH